MVTYEWSLETIEDGDIIDSDFSDSLVWNAEELKGNELVLVRNEGNENEGVTDRFWAYVKNSKLPEFFQDGGGQTIKIKVPQKFHKELQKYYSK